MNYEQKIDFIYDLPLEMVEKIFYYLDADAVAQVVKVSKHWEKMFQNDFICNKLCQKNNVLQVEEKHQTAVCKKFLALFDCYNYGLWAYYLKLKQNWMEKPLGELFRPNYNLSMSSSISYLDEQIIIFASEEWSLLYGMSLKFEVHNAERKLIDKFHAGRYYECCYMSREGDAIVIGIRNMWTNNCVVLLRDVNNKTFLFNYSFNAIGIEDNYNFLVAHNKEVIAANGQDENKISVICVKTRNLKLELQYYDFLGFMKFYNEKLVVLTWSAGGADIHVVTFLDTYRRSMESVFRLNIAVNSFNGVIMEGEYLIAAFNNQTYFFNVNENKLVYVFTFRSELQLRSFIIKNCRAIFLESNRCLKILNYTNGNCVATIKDEDLFNTVTVNNKFLISASKENESSTTYKIKIFDFVTGKLLRTLLLPIEMTNVNYLKATETMLLIGFNPAPNRFVSDVAPNNNLILALDFDVSL